MEVPRTTSKNLPVKDKTEDANVAMRGPQAQERILAVREEIES